MTARDALACNRCDRNGKVAAKTAVMGQYENGNWEWILSLCPWCNGKKRRVCYWCGKNEATFIDIDGEPSCADCGTFHDETRATQKSETPLTDSSVHNPDTTETVELNTEPSGAQK